MYKMEPVCKDCKERKEFCHTNCEKYKKAKFIVSIKKRMEKRKNNTK